MKARSLAPVAWAIGFRDALIRSAMISIVPSFLNRFRSPPAYGMQGFNVHIPLVEAMRHSSARLPGGTTEHSISNGRTLYKHRLFNIFFAIVFFRKNAFGRAKSS
jgi:hypothetical protein